MKIIDDTYCLETKPFIDYLKNNKIENVIFCVIHDYTHQFKKNNHKVLSLLCYYYKEGEQIFIENYTDFETIEDLNIRVNEINTNKVDSMFLIDDYLHPELVSNMDIFLPIFKSYLLTINEIYNPNNKILFIKPLQKLNYLISEYQKV